MAGPLSSSRNAPAGSFFSFFFLDDGPPPPEDDDDDDEEDVNARVLRPHLVTAESGLGGAREEEENCVVLLLLDDDNDEGESADKSREEDVDVMPFLSLFYGVSLSRARAFV